MSANIKNETLNLPLATPNKQQVMGITDRASTILILQQICFIKKLY